MPNHPRMYRAHIIKYPRAELRDVWRDVDVNYGDETITKRHEYTAYVPADFQPDDDYIARFHTTDWVEPSTEKWFKSRSSAKSRVDMLRAVGYGAIVQQSAPLVWPKDGQTRVPKTTPNVAQALKIVKDAGFTVSA